jgi:PAS domain-containing protein
MDEQGRIMKYNQALLNFLGRDSGAITGRSLAEFFANPEDWESLGQALCQGSEAVEKEVPMVVQSGYQLPARVQLAPCYMDQLPAGSLGRIRPREAESCPGIKLSLEEAEHLADLSGQAIDDINDLLTAFRSQVQLVLMSDHQPQVRTKLELLERLTQDGAQVVSRVQGLVEGISRRSRAAVVENDLWKGELPASNRED